MTQVLGRISDSWQPFTELTPSGLFDDEESYVFFDEVLK
jgi:hypothetical protein